MKTAIQLLIAVRRQISNKKGPQNKGNRIFKRCDQACKPSSVVCDNLSRQDVAVLLKPPFGSAGPAVTFQSVLHRIGFTEPGRLRPAGELLPRLSILTGKTRR